VSSRCQPGLIADGQDGAFGIAIDATHVYWSTTNGVIARKPRAGGDIQVIANGESTPQHVAVADGYVYWASHAGSIRRAHVEGGAAEDFVGALTDPTGVAVQGPVVYYTEKKGTVGIYNADAGTGSQPLGGIPSIGDIDALGTEYFYGDGEGIDSVTLFGGVAKVVGAPRTVGVALVNNVFYFTTPDTGEIARASSDGTPEAIVSGQNAPAGIAGDSTAVFWCEGGAGRVWRLVL
jgi:hypothetical protein